MLVEERYKRLWRLEQDGPAVRALDVPQRDQFNRPTPKEAQYRLAGSPATLIYVSSLLSFVARGYALQRGDEFVISQAGREALASRPDLTAWYEAERRVHNAHKFHDGTPEERAILEVQRNQGLYICSCGWRLVYNDPWSRQWADEFPAMEHFTRLIDTEILAVVREREGRA